MKSAYWKNTDFWLACLAGITFWLVFGLFFAPEQTTNIDIDYKLMLVVIIFPVLEEIVFRGLIQESIQQLLTNSHFNTTFFWRVSRANLITSLLFSASHLWSQSAQWALAILIPSLIFGYFKDRYHSLQPPILLHIFYNCGFYLLI